MNAIDKIRYEYNAELTDEQILTALNKAPKLPESAGPFSRRLEGESIRIVLDNGDRMDIGFKQNGEIYGACGH